MAMALTTRCACRGKDRLSVDFVRAAVDMASTLIAQSLIPGETDGANSMRARTSVVWTISFMDE